MVPTTQLHTYFDRATPRHDPRSWDLHDLSERHPLILISAERHGPAARHRSVAEVPLDRSNGSWNGDPDPPTRESPTTC